ncbi:MAG: DMT superfamily drug/metabolite permease [Ignavibacteria bacterium]|nr:MAG: DMT superfamily drug/metabolite permease [Ignavibacteria bacterium]KAF0161864.1 MAG: DMT superfamily drug/metabolite permease [Ignavibacteria bacterium]
MTENKNIFAYLALFSIYIIWGTTYLAIKIGVQELPPALFTGLRWLAAGPLLMGILLLRKYKLPNKQDWIHLGISGLLLIGGGNGLVVFAEQWVPSGLTALLITTVPFWIVGIEALLPNGKKINIFVALGLILGLAGTAMIFGGDFHKLFEPSYLRGVIGLMVAVASWSVGTIYSKYKKVSVHPLMGAAGQMIFAGVVITIFGLLIGESRHFHFTNSSLLAYLYLVIFGSLLGYGSYIYAIAHLPVSLVSTYAYVNPIIALFLGWLILNEPITIWIVAASAVILVGVTFVKKGSEQK